MVDGNAVVAQFFRERHNRRRRTRERVEIGNLRADVDVQPGKLETVAGGKSPADVAHGIGGHTELVRLQPGRDMRVTARIDVGIDPQCHADAGAAFVRESIDAIQLPFRLGVDRPDAEIDRLRQLRRRLADPGEHNLIGNEPGTQRDIDLAARIRIGTGAQRAQQPRHAQRRVGLERVMERMWISAERLVDGAIACGNRSRTVDIQRGTFSGREIRQRHTFAIEGVVDPIETFHQSLIVVEREAYAPNGRLI
jgi:hypothetical protein